MNEFTTRSDIQISNMTAYDLTTLTTTIQWFTNVTMDTVTTMGIDTMDTVTMDTLTPALPVDPRINCTTELPSAKEYFPAVSTAYKFTFGMCGAITLSVLLLYLETLLWLQKHDHERDKFPQEKTKWILAIYPIFCVTSLVGILIPRSSNVNRLIATVYLAGCIYQFVTMLISNHGGYQEMADKMQGLRMKIIPFFNCDACLPHVTPKSIRYAQKTVLGFTVLSTLLVYAMAVIWANQHYYIDVRKNPSLYINIFTVVLTVFAVWGLRVVKNLSASLLGKDTLQPKVICLQLVVACNNFQSSAFNIFIISGVIRCDQQLSAEAVGLRYHDILIIFEMFFISLAARSFYRKIYPSEEGFNIMENGKPMTTYSHFQCGVSDEEALTLNMEGESEIQNPS